MNFSEFCNVFYDKERNPKCAMSGCNSQGDIIKFFCNPFLKEGNHKNEDDPLSDYYDYNELNKIFHNIRHITVEIWDMMKKSYSENEEVLKEFLYNNLLESGFEKVIGDFDIQVSSIESLDINALIIAITSQFYALICGHGEARNIASDTYKNNLQSPKFRRYLIKAKEKFSYKKTLFYPEGQPLVDFYVCNELKKSYSFADDVDDRIIENPTLIEINKYTSYALIYGNGGVGKSCLMQKLMLDSLENGIKTGEEVPIFVILNQFNKENGLMQLIYEAMNKFDKNIGFEDVGELLSSGKAKLLLDGLDEIKYEDMERFNQQLETLVLQFDMNQFVMSSRKYSELFGIDNFKGFTILPFSKKKAMDLIKNLHYGENDDDEQSIKSKFLVALDERLYDEYHSFASNPLLLTIMFMNYRRFKDVPSEIHRFYKEAYETIVRLHDTEEKGMVREYRSVDDVDKFTDLFSEFCAKSYRRGDIKFNDIEFEYYFKRVTENKDLSSKTTLTNFQYDVCHSACIMMKDDYGYSFIHRSFQEYLFAHYYILQGDETLNKLSNFFGTNEGTAYDDNNGLHIMYKLQPTRVEDQLILPYLDKLLCAEENVTLSPQEKYYYFISKAYKYLQFDYFDKDNITNYNKDHSRLKIRPIVDCIHPSVLFLFIVNILELNKGYYTFTIDNFDENNYDDYIYAHILGRYHSYNKERLVLSQVTKETLSERTKNEKNYIRNEKGDVVLMGHTLLLNTSLLLENSIKYKPFKDVLDKESDDLFNLYESFKDYYNRIKVNYNNRLQDQENY